MRNRKAAETSRKRPRADFDVSRPVDRYSRFNAFQEDEDDELEQKSLFATSLNVLLFSVGCGFLMYVMKNYAKYIKETHENYHTFSKIQVK